MGLYHWSSGEQRSPLLLEVKPANLRTDEVVDMLFDGGCVVGRDIKGCQFLVSIKLSFVVNAIPVEVKSMCLQAPYACGVVTGGTF